MSDLREKLEKLVSGDESALLHERVRFEEENKEWLDHSGHIAVAVLFVLQAKNMTQKALAEKMGISPQQVNKIVQGRENMSLQTIGKLETALGVSLIRIKNHEPRKPRKQAAGKKEKR